MKKENEPGMLLGGLRGNALDALRGNGLGTESLHFSGPEKEKASLTLPKTWSAVWNMCMSCLRIYKAEGKRHTGKLRNGD